MIFIDELKEAVNIMLHPGTATQKERSIRAAIAFYYKVLAIPLILYIILALAIPKPTLNSSMSSSPFATLTLLIVILLIVSPLVLLVDAGLYHLFGKFLFKVFKNPYSNTFTATVYSTVPFVLLVWLLGFISIANPVLLVGILIIFVILGIWGVIITIIALANQQKTSRLTAFAMWIVPEIILGAAGYLVAPIAALFELGSLSSSSSSLLASTCIPQIGFGCTNPVFSGGVLNMTIAQATGQSWTTATLCFVPGNVTMSSNLTCPTGYETSSYNIPSGLASNQSVPVKFALSGVSTKPGTIVSGTIWAIYTTSGATSPTSVEIAAVTAQEK